MRVREKRTIRGFTLIEVMIVVAILAIFMAFVFTNIMNARRISANEDVRLDLDRVGNQVLRTISSYAKDAVLPVRPRPVIRLPLPEDPKTAAEMLTSTTRGFGANAKAWETRLVNGANFLAFCTPIDADGSGDCLDGDLLPYLGISHPLAIGDKAKNQITEQDKYDSDFKLAGNSNISPGLAALAPDDIQVLGNAPAAAEPALPKGGAYALIRFVPLLMTDGSPVTVHEGVDTGGAVRGLHCDINGDGRYETTRQYYMGNIEIRYPNVDWVDLESGSQNSYAALTTRLGTMDMVAVPKQEDRTQADWVDAPIFTLVSLKDDGSLVEVKGSDLNRPDELMFDSLRIQLTLVNYHDRDNIRAGDPDHPGTGGEFTQNKYWQSGSPGQRNNVMAKRYEGIVRLRNL